MLIGSPIMPIGLTESSPGQLQAEGARGRLEIVPEDEPPVAEIELQFRAATAAAYQQLRDALWRATRSGADPLLLLPAPSFAGAGRVLHGRVENRVTFSWETPGADGVRAFALPFHESPFAAPIP
jgi:hypothetical protein